MKNFDKVSVMLVIPSPRNAPFKMMEVVWKACFKTGHLVVTNALKQQKKTPVCSV